MNTKTVIITGVSKGIGREIAIGFLSQGHVVIGGSRTRPDNALLEHENFFHSTGDLCEEQAHKGLCTLALETTGKIDVYINNVGFSQWYTIDDIKEKDIDQMLSINLKSTIWGCKVAAAAMHSGGSIINISSLAGKRGTKNNSLYCASKFAVNGLTQCLSKELGERKIRVNALCPVLIKTPGLVDALVQPNAPAEKVGTDAFLNKFTIEQTALQRLPEAGEVANTCLFLSSEGASAITGQCINIDCGVLPQ